jgi:hypothetical protein
LPFPGFIILSHLLSPVICPPTLIPSSYLSTPLLFPFRLFLSLFSLSMKAVLDQERREKQKLVDTIVHYKRCETFMSRGPTLFFFLIVFRPETSL